MPYIKQYRRNDFDEHIRKLFPANPGELNYIITMTILNFWKQNTQNYQKINDIIGALECAKQEFYRRVVINYEEEKIKLNGDVY